MRIDPLRSRSLRICVGLAVIASLLVFRPRRVVATNAQRWPGDDPATTHADTVLVGDSIAKAWAPRGALNHAIGRQTLQDVYDNLTADALVYNPRVLIVEGGINDLRNGASSSRLVWTRVKILAAAYARGERVYFANLTPVNTGSSLCGEVDTRALARFNALAPRICRRGLRCVVVDFAGAFGPEYDPSLFLDCVHPNAAGNARLDRAFAAAVGAP